MSNYPYNHGYPWYTSRSDNRNTNIHADIHADIDTTDLGAQFTANIRGCTYNSTLTSVMLLISKRISARTVRPGYATFLLLDNEIKHYLILHSLLKKLNG